jgi:hypothetical protein
VREWHERGGETRETGERGRARDTEVGSCKGSARADLTTLMGSHKVTIRTKNEPELGVKHVSILR